MFLFQKFIKLCAARIRQLLNFSNLAVNCGISVPTVRQWLSILEASYIIFLLKPYWVNFNKRITKTPEIYFYDTGLACSLLEIDSPKSLLLNPYYGNLFECFVVADFFKQFFNQGAPARFFDSLHKWSVLARQSAHRNYLVYAGSHSFSSINGNLVSCKQAGNLIKKLT